MKITYELDLIEFKFWAGGKVIADKLTNGELMTIQQWLEEMDWVLSETDINDFFWFDTETIADILGYRDEDEFITTLLRREICKRYN